MLNYSLDNLNDEQKMAVTTTEGYVRVIAGAGSGKTNALTHRFVYLVNDLGISPSGILCVTFTNKAAAEMKKRIRKMIGDVDLGFICTFHSFCVQLLKEDCHVVQYPKQFIILDEEDVKKILLICFEHLGITSKQYTVKKARDDISFRKTHSNYYELLNDTKLDKLKEARNSAISIKEKVFYEFLYEQRKLYGFDFDDLIIFAIYILESDKNVKEKWQKRLEYIMVDEFQDVNDSQYTLATILSEYHQNMFIVGDPDQTIYTWRGAKISHILNFDQVHPNCKTIIMDKNYRSLSKVINASNSLIQKNRNRIEKSLIPVRLEDGQAVYYHAKNQYIESEWVADQICTLKEHGTQLSEIAILYRAHYVSRQLEEMFMYKKIPYKIYSGIGFYGRKEIKDILSYLRMVISSDDLSFMRIINEPKRGIGKTKMGILHEYAEEHNCLLYDALLYNLENTQFRKTKAAQFCELIEKYKSIYSEMLLTDLLTAMLNESGYEESLRIAGDEDRLDNLAELKQSLYDYETTAGEDVSLETYLQHTALFTNLDKHENLDSVKMMTIHSAKGLEFPYVFVCGLCEGIFPSRKTNTREKLEEERRLAYVAYTRAKDRLFLTDSEGINNDGTFRLPSRFIFNTEQVNLDYVVQLDSDLVDDAQNFIKNDEDTIYCMSTFKEGDRVEHNIFGTGEIVLVNNNNSCYLIKFDEFDTTRSISFKNKLRMHT